MHVSGVVSENVYASACPRSVVGFPVNIMSTHAFCLVNACRLHSHYPLLYLYYPCLAVTNLMYFVILAQSDCRLR